MERKETHIKRTLQYIVLIFVSALLFSCDSPRNHPGWDYFPDMAYSNAYETYAVNPNFVDAKTMRQPIEGTVPRHVIPLKMEEGIEAMEQAGKDLENPLTKNSENIERGKMLYGRFCVSCHGEKADGKGYLFTSRKYLVPPRTLISKEKKNSPDGELFHSISTGFGVMGAHQSLISQEDRWRIVLYIRELQSN